MSGYLHPGYARSLSEFGAPRELPASGGWVLERAIPGSDARDAMGCYPLFACRDWACLEKDLSDLTGLVSIALVTDPFGGCDPELLRRAFDVAAPFKDHLIADLSKAPGEFVSEHHQYYARRAAKKVAVLVHPDPPALLDTWLELYGVLIERHGLRGIKAFSRAAFSQQLALPGAVLLEARSDGRTVGAHLFYVQDRVAYSHLCAMNEQGYTAMASYALHWKALEHFAALGVRWLDLGAGPGLAEKQEQGLGWFKQGWATETRPVFFCGRVLDRERYGELCRRQGSPETKYFPAYRAGELA